MGKAQIKKVMASDISDDFIGDGKSIIEWVSNLEKIDEKCLAFYKGDDIDMLKSLPAGALIVNEAFRQQDLGGHRAKCIIFSNNPMLTFAKFVNSIVDDSFSDIISTKLDDNKVSVRAYIEQHVTLGKNNIIFPNVAVFNGVTIGDSCKIQSNTVVGASGMSYTKDEEDEYHVLNHVGNVIIHDNVDIGSNSTIMKGILESTVIEKGTKIGNLVNIGHNCRVGKRCYISAGVTIGGATQIGNDCWFAPGVSIRDNITIGDNCTIGVGSVVVKSTEPNAIYYGNPAKLVRYK